MSWCEVGANQCRGKARRRDDWRNAVLLNEMRDQAGALQCTWLDCSAEGLRIRVEREGAVEAVLPLSTAAVAKVMARYGKPIDASLESEVASLQAGVILEDGSHLCRFRFRPRYDVIAKDYIVLRVPGQASRAELAVSICAALTHLARAMGPEQG